MNVRHLVPTLALVAVILEAGCATRSAPSANGFDPEQGGEALRRDGRIPASRQPTQEELERAFGNGSDLGDPAQARGAIDHSPPPEVAAQLAARRDFEQMAAALEAELKRGVMAPSPDLGQRAAALDATAKNLGPRERVRALSLRAAASRIEGDLPSAHGLSWSWLHACGPTEVDACRRAALAEAGRSTAGAPDARRAVKRIAEIREHDACVRSAEGAARKKGTPLPPCLDKAAAHYRREGDGLMSARVAAARAESKSRAQERGAPGDLERAAAVCAEPRCRELRRRLWQRLAQVQSVNGNREEAAKAALQDVGLHAESLPPGERAWAWTDLAEKTCAAWDAEAGEGRCRKLEGTLLGRHHFKDFSRPPAARGREGLSSEVVRAVNAHYAQTFEPCLAEQAARLRPPAHEQYTVRWTVGNDGRVTRMELSRRELQDGPLARCLMTALGLWRYPRFEGELQHVEQTFGVTARASRGS